MGFPVLQTILQYLIMYSFAFEDFIYVYGEGNKEMAEQGRTQYQMIKERGTLPKYGPCWRAAIEHLDEGCRHLSEDTQSDIALHITNCFLEMSGHETYNCELDKKDNLRRICISSMTDRAFNVYTEFYTHTQNICWFLRGQIWHETIAENTLKVGKQLEISAEHQQDLIKVQKESLQMQERMLQQGRFLEKVLEDVYVSTKTHQEVLTLLTHSVASLQSWLVGEISWIDSIIFNSFALFLIFVFTSTRRTITARLPLFLLLALNIIVERLVCSLYNNYHKEYETHSLYNNLHGFVWYVRYGFTFLGAVVYLYFVLTYQDMFEQNLSALDTIRKQNNKILKVMEGFRRSKTPMKASTIIEFTAEDDRSSKRSSMDLELNNADKSKTLSSIKKNQNKYDREGSVDHRLLEIDGFHSKYARKKVLENNNYKYNLRNHSRQGTPDSGVVH